MNLRIENIAFSLNADISLKPSQNNRIIQTENDRQRVWVCDLWWEVELHRDVCVCACVRVCLSSEGQERGDIVPDGSFLHALWLSHADYEILLIETVESRSVVLLMKPTMLDGCYDGYNILIFHLDCI